MVWRLKEHSHIIQINISQHTQNYENIITFEQVKNNSNRNAKDREQTNKQNVEEF